MNISTIIQELATAAALPDQDPDRAIYIMAALTKAFVAVQCAIPILVGGGAVEFYTKGYYTTSDVDALQHSTEKVAAVMTSLGFVRRGKDWIHGTIPRLYVEFPGIQGVPDWVFHNVVPVGDVDVHIITPESLIIDKLGSYSIGNPVDGVNVLALMAANGQELNWEFLRETAKREQVLQHLEHLWQMATEVDWTNPPPRDELERKVSPLNVPGYVGSIKSGVLEGDDHADDA